MQVNSAVVIENKTAYSARQMTKYKTESGQWSLIAYHQRNRQAQHVCISGGVTSHLVHVRALHAASEVVGRQETVDDGGEAPERVLLVQQQQRDRRDAVQALSSHSSSIHVLPGQQFVKKKKKKLTTCSQTNNPMIALPGNIP